MKKILIGLVLSTLSLFGLGQQMGKSSQVGREITWDWKKSKVKGDGVQGEQYYITTNKDSVYIINYDSYGELSYWYWMALNDIFIPAFSDPKSLMHTYIPDNALILKGKGFQKRISDYGNDVAEWKDNFSLEIACDNAEKLKLAKSIISTAFPEKVFNKLLDFELGTVAEEDKPLYEEMLAIKSGDKEREKQAIAARIAAKEANKKFVGNYDGIEEYRYASIYKGENKSEYSKVLLYDRKTGEVSRRRNSNNDFQVEAYLRANAGSKRFFQMYSSDNETPKYNASDNGFSCVYLGANSKQLSEAQFKTSDPVAETYSFSLDNLKDKKKYNISRTKETIADAKGTVLYSTEGQLNGVELMLLLAFLEDI